MSKETNFKKLFAILGILGPVYFFVLITVLGPIWNGYDFIGEFISILGSDESPYRYLMNILGFVAFGLIIGFFAESLDDQLTPNILTHWAKRLLRAGSMLVVIMGLFPADRYNHALTLTGDIHRMASLAALLVIPASVICYAYIFWFDTKWGGFWSVFSGASVSISLACGGLLIFTRGEVYAGFVERVGVIALLLWVFIVSLNLLLSYKLDEIFPPKK